MCDGEAFVLSHFQSVNDEAFFFFFFAFDRFLCVRLLLSGLKLFWRQIREVPFVVVDGVCVRCGWKLGVFRVQFFNQRSLLLTSSRHRGLEFPTLDNEFVG